MHYLGRLRKNAAAPRRDCWPGVRTISPRMPGYDHRFSRADPELLDAYWRAANYLSVGQIYLLDNPLLREPLKLEHIKPRLLGHWGAAPSLNLILCSSEPAYMKHNLNVVYIAGPAIGDEHVLPPRLAARVGRWRKPLFE
jgi:phosphoketolase